MNAENDITKIITEEQICLNLKGTSKHEVIDELSQLLYDNALISDIAEFTKDVLFRESEGITGLGYGIAIPHGKSDYVLKTAIVIGKCHSPVVWESLDNQPVELIIMFAVKNVDATTLHIKLLQQVAAILADEDKIKQLKSSQTKQEIMALLANR